MSETFTGWLSLAQQRQPLLTKPPGSLGRLEEIANRICAMRQTLRPTLRKPMIYVFAADHGVCAEGVNSYPQSVTRQMVDNFLAGGAAINAIAQSVGAELQVADVGIIGETLQRPALLTHKLGNGTGNICREQAMSLAQADEGVSFGLGCAEEAVSGGCELLGFGEMGIGNTTVASAICSVLTSAAPELVCGRGTAGDDAKLALKRDAITQALELHKAQIELPLDLISCLGGFEIAAMCGFCIGAARRRVPLLMDGFIATAAAAIAVWWQPETCDYLIAAHQSPEPGHALLLNHLKLEPLLDLGMRLGEGTGAALAIPIVQAAVAAFTNMATFTSAGVAQSEPVA